MYEADDPNGRRNIPPDHRTLDFRLRFLPRQADSVRRQVTIVTAKMNLLHLIFASHSFFFCLYVESQWLGELSSSSL